MPPGPNLSFFVQLMFFHHASFQFNIQVRALIVGLNSSCHLCFCKIQNMICVLKVA